MVSFFLPLKIDWTNTCRPYTLTQWLEEKESKESKQLGRSIPEWDIGNFNMVIFREVRFGGKFPD